MQIKKYKIGLGYFDNVYLRFTPGRLYFGTEGPMHYFSSQRVAEDWIDEIAKIHGTEWKSRMFVCEVVEYLMTDVDVCFVDGIFKGWKDCVYE